MRAIGLDVGGVLLRSPWELLLEQRPNITRAGVEILGPFSDGKDRYYEAFASGSLSETEYWEYFSERIKVLLPEFYETDNPVRDLLLLSEIPIRTLLVKWLTQFHKSGGKIYTFSNGLYKNMGRDWANRTLPADLIELHFDASETGLRKPDERTFYPLIEGRSKISGTTLYVDDNPHYVACSVRAGLHGLTFCVIDPQRSLAAMSKFYSMDAS